MKFIIKLFYHFHKIKVTEKLFKIQNSFVSYLKQKNIQKYIL